MRARTDSHRNPPTRDRQMTNARTGRDEGPGRHARPRSNWVERTLSRYSAVQLSEIETMFVALSVGRFAVLSAWLADALDDDGLPIVDDDGD